jgi:hypothetical protein
MHRIYSSIVLVIGIIITAVVLGGAWTRSHHKQETINVTGLANRDFVSDLIVWNGSFSAKSMNMQEAYAKLKRDAELVKNYLIGKGIPEKEIVFSAVVINRDYETVTERDDSQKEIFTGYRLNQELQIESSQVEKVEKVSREVTELIDQGVELYSSQPQYYYTKLSALKLDLLASATKDARQRAEKIAENAGSGIGKMLMADMGIFQITAQNSAENYSWGGTFNTASKRKTASITVHLEFEVD